MQQETENSERGWQVGWYQINVGLKNEKSQDLVLRYEKLLTKDKNGPLGILTT